MSADTDDLELTDDDFLALVGEEMRQSIGFDNDDELSANREKALEYAKGEMDDVKSLPNRSAAVSTDLADALETIKPDLMEVFTGGDDVATFRPHGLEDEAGAAQETDYVNHVLYNENPGWRIIYTIIHDALLTKIGVVKVWGETFQEEQEETFSGQPQMALQIASMEAEARGGEVRDIVAGDPDPDTGDPLFSFKVVTRTPKGACKVMNVPPEDFTVARDTVLIPETTYCAMRTRPRAQDLIADGYDHETIEELPAYGTIVNDQIEQARDTAGEHTQSASLVVGQRNLHQVEILEHYLRVDADGDGKPELWCVVTDAACRTLLKRERVDRIPFSVSTPFIVTHRLYGLSLADKIFEVQRIKTTLLRMMLDSGYFALNQRHVVDMSAANEFTLADLLNNTPGQPVRAKSAAAVQALGSASLSFDIFGAMEFMSTVLESRTGVVRNAQGLNPDTLHDTAKGMSLLATAAQKRVRMIARVFAETGLKDLFLLIHAVTRTMPPPGAMVRLRGQWVQIDPTSWGERNDMSIEVGIGSGGREMELAALDGFIAAQEKLIHLQGGTAEGPFVTAENVYNTAKRRAELSGLKNAERYVTDPAKAQAGPPKPPPVDPEVVKVEKEMELRRYEIDQKIALEREQMQAEFQLRRDQLTLEARLKAVGDVTGGIGQDVRLGGMPG